MIRDYRAGIFILALCLGPATSAMATEYSIEAWMTAPLKTPKGTIAGSAAAMKKFDAFKRQSAPSTKLDTSTYSLIIDSEKQYQTIEGWGANLTESSVITLARLSRAKRAEALRLLFDPKKGAGFTVLRVPIGASEFVDVGGGYYTYDETPDGNPDPEFKYFTMERDRKSLDLLKEIKRINPKLTLILTAWTGPTWMKTNKAFKGGYLKPEFRKDYGRYLARTIEEYSKKLRYSVLATSILNEPGVDHGYNPSMAMSPAEQATLIADALEPALRERGLTTPIIVHDHNWDMVDDVIGILSNPRAYERTSGIAVHCYTGDIEDVIWLRALYPQKDIYQTECTGIMDSGGFTDDFQWWINTQVIQGANLGSKVGLGWNLTLDETGGPVLDGCKGCRGLLTIDSKTGSFAANAEYYALAHGSRFVKPGAVRVSVEEGDGKLAQMSSTAFLNPDGSLVLIVANGGDKPIPLEVSAPSDRVFQFVLPALAGMTITLRDKVVSPASALNKSKTTSAP
jgi:glucosylceramidase